MELQNGSVFGYNRAMSTDNEAKANTSVEKAAPAQVKPAKKARAPRNRTLTLSPQEQTQFLKRCLTINTLTELASAPDTSAPVDALTNKTILADFYKAVDYLPAAFVDLLFVDPPYNLDKKFNSSRFTRMSSAEYKALLDEWFARLAPLLKPTASVYVCSDWRSTAEVVEVLDRYFTVRNRITWEREKGRGAQHNWKNSSEDIWFATVSNDYYFNVDAVKLKRRVMAPYRDSNGKPKDWQTTESGSFRLTYPSNLWTDITVPYWSMPENTEHPTQKPEKLLAKIILASSREGDLVFDPFLGSGTTSVVAKKLDRGYCGIEREPEYAALCEKRLESAADNSRIQGYETGIFYERNSSP